MKDTGIIYGSSSGKTESVAVRICQRLGNDRAALLDIGETRCEEMMNYRNLILGIPTWGIGRLQEDWDAALPVVEKLDLKGRTVALFGLGDQESYPDTFADALGKLYDVISRSGCRITGGWRRSGYDFEASMALRGDGFVGLVIDEENQAELTDLRIVDWLERLELG